MKLNYFFIASLFILFSQQVLAQITHENERLEYQLATKDLLRRSQNVTDPQLLLLLAKQSALFAERYGFENEIHSDLHRLAYRARKATLIDSVYKSSRFVTREIATAIGDSTLNQYLLPPDPKDKRFNRFTSKAIPVRSVNTSKDGLSLFSVTADGKVLKWEIRNRTNVLLVQNEKLDRIISLSSNEQWLAFATNENEIELIDLKQNNLKAEKINFHKGSIVDLEFLPDNTGFITVGIDRQILKYDFGTRQSHFIALFDGTPTGMSLSSNGRDLVVISRNGKIMLYDLQDPEITTRELYIGLNENHSLEVVQFSNSGRYLSFGGSNTVTGFGFVSLWDSREKSLYGPILNGFTSGITEIKFSIDDRWVAAASRDNSTLIWNMKGPNNFPIILDDHQDWVWSVSFHPSSDQLFTASADGIIRAFYLDYKEYLVDACQKLNRNLDLNEWTTYIGDPEKFPLEETCPSVN